MTVVLDNTRVIKNVGTLMDEVINHLMQINGAKVGHRLRRCARLRRIVGRCILGIVGLRGDMRIASLASEWELALIVQALKYHNGPKSVVKIDDSIRISVGRCIALRL